MSYVFNIETLHAIARLVVGKTHDEMVRIVVEETARVYPAHIDSSPKRQWLFSLTSGATGVMTLLHASFSEYLIIFGTPVGTEGFSGRYRMDIHDFLLAGEVWTYRQDRCGVREVVRPGDHTVLEHGKVNGFKIPDSAWMLEYGRGFIPSAFPLILGDVLFSAVDGTTLVETVWAYVKMALRELAVNRKF
jgi:ERG2 and Sigma1 receptor like protein